MGHVTDTYNDIESLGIEFLRNKYADSGLGIRRKTQLDEYEKMRIVARAMGVDPDKAINKEAFLKPHRTILDPQQQKQEKIDILANAIRESLLSTISVD